MDNEATTRVVYEAAVRAASDQASVLDGLRARAGTVLAATALVSSFLGGQALRNAEHLRALSLIGLALALFAVSALLVLTILWPFDFRFGLSAQHSSSSGAIVKIDEQSVGSCGPSSSVSCISSSK
jgi:hypothetical protein